MTDYKCEKCKVLVAEKSKDVCDKYPELEGKVYCPTHRDEKLKELGKWCKVCGEARALPDKDICYSCSRKGLVPEVTAITRVTDITQQIEPIVRPAVDIETAMESWRAFQQLKDKLKQDTDITTIKGAEYLNKSFWRKIATFFNLTSEVAKREVLRNDKTQRITEVYFEVKVIAPNGRAMVGVGTCSRYERNFAHAEHDITAMAYTRALNRAISDMVAGGAVSAEEMGDYVIEGE